MYVDYKMGNILQYLIILWIHQCDYPSKSYSQHYIRDKWFPAKTNVREGDIEVVPFQDGPQPPGDPQGENPGEPSGEDSDEDGPGEHLDLEKLLEHGIEALNLDYVKKKHKKFLKKFILKESLYEPYWRSGEWVFSRTTHKLYKRKTTKPRRTTRTNYTIPQSTRAGQTAPTTRAPYVNLECQHPCPFAFEDYGQVCGQRYNGIVYEMKQFDDMCDLYAANCIDPAKEKEEFLKQKAEGKIPSKDGQRRGEWRVLYRGPCWERTTGFRYPPTAIKSILSRASYLNKVVHDRKSTHFR